MPFQKKCRELRGQLGCQANFDAYDAVTPPPRLLTWWRTLEPTQTRGRSSVPSARDLSSLSKRNNLFFLEFNLTFNNVHAVPKNYLALDMADNDSKKMKYNLLHLSC